MQKKEEEKKRIDKLGATFFSRSKDPKAKFHYPSDRARSAELIYFSLSSFQSPLDKQKEEPHSQESISPSERRRNNTGDRKNFTDGPCSLFLCFYLRRDRRSAPSPTRGRAK